MPPMDAPLYLLVLCTALWCPLYERESGYTLSREDCVAQMAMVRAHNPRQTAYCLRQGGYEIVGSDGRSRWTRNEVR